jgi:uncharacterized protein
MKIRHLDLSHHPVNDEHETLGLPPLELGVASPVDSSGLNLAVWFTGFVLLSLSAFLVGSLFWPGNAVDGWQVVLQTLDSHLFWSALAVGLIAQVIDGALGMAYGLTATTFLLGAGASPAAASASVHIAEIFTTGVSGVSHAKLGNVSKPLFMRLLIPGILGAVLGAIVVTQIDGSVLKPYISAYLLIMGVYILSKAFRQLRPKVRQAPRHVGKLALFGGFIDAAGGGGWGPVVTTTLVGSGQDPRTSIGSVNFAEFFLTLAGAATFTLLSESGIWLIVAGLVIGGLFAAPFAAVLTRRLNTRSLLVLVGLLITVVSSYNLHKALGF